MSGGADSVALAWWLHELAARPATRVNCAGLIHVNHALRGADSDADEAFCRALAARLGLPIEVVHAPVLRTRRSPEVAARAARYDALALAAGRLGASRIATAHTADDQAETLLLRLLRGAGTRGVSGIRAQHGAVVRPLLACRRSTLRAFLVARGETWREDASNADLSIPRNRVRHELLPALERVAAAIAPGGPGGINALARCAALAADDEAYFSSVVTAFVSRTVVAGTAAVIPLDALRAEPAAIARRVIRAVAERVAPGHAWSARHLEAVHRLAARAQGGGQLDLPGVFVERVSNEMRFRARSRGSETPVGPFEYRLDVPGEVVVPEAGLVFVAARVDARPASPAASGEPGVPGEHNEHDTIVIADPGPCVVIRNRRPGDRVGMGSGRGTRKLQDLMVDRKIPRGERDRMPLVVGSNGHILWGPGLRPPGGARPGTPEGGMVVLMVRKLEKA